LAAPSTPYTSGADVPGNLDRHPWPTTAGTAEHQHLSLGTQVNPVDEPFPTP